MSRPRLALRTHPRLRRGDTVRVLVGKDRGKKGRILAVIPREGRVIVEGVNQVFKHIRPRRKGEKGQRVQIAAPLNISNVQLVCPSCRKSTRVGIRREQQERLRICKQCEATIPSQEK